MQRSRLFEIVYLLMNKNAVTAKELAEHFEVSRRTIYRDIDALALAGVPVYTDRGKGGGIRLVEDFVLNKSLLNEKEQGEILSALQGLSAMKAEDAGSVLDKLSSLFNRSAANWLEVDFSDWGSGHGDLFRLLKTAILERKVVEFSYFNAYGEETPRRVEPLRLCFKHRAWYLRGFCLVKNDMRLFRLTRIKNPVPTGETFRERSVAEAPSQSEGKQAHEIALKLRIAPEMAYRVFDEFSEELYVKNGDGSYTVSVRWPEDGWVYGFLLSFGEYLTVLEPPHVKEVLRERLKKSLAAYS